MDASTDHKSAETTLSLHQKDSKRWVEIIGARVHNLKNVDAALPRGGLSVITGLSGSGKSSLAFDTLYAEGQRRYVESLSSYARQFLGQMNKPECDFIKGIPPAIAIEQKVNNRNPRSTVGTSTEIYEYLKLLYARIGKTYSPISGTLVKKDNPEDLVTCMQSREEGTRFLLLAPIPKRKGRTLESLLQIYLQFSAFPQSGTHLLYRQSLYEYTFLFYLCICRQAFHRRDNCNTCL